MRLSVVILQGFRVKLAHLSAVPDDSGGGQERKGARKAGGKLATHGGWWGIGWTVALWIGR